MLREVVEGLILLAIWRFETLAIFDDPRRVISPTPRTGGLGVRCGEYGRIVLIYNGIFKMVRKHP